MKNYTYPSDLFSLSIPDEWSIEYNHPTNKFENPQLIFSQESSNSRLLFEINYKSTNELTHDTKALEFYTNKLKNEYHKISIEQSSLTAYEIDNEQTISFLFEIPLASSYDNSVNLKGVKIFLPLSSEKEIEITFTTFKSNFENQIKIVDKIISSIRINNNV